jgi:hypothetical protein
MRNSILSIHISPTDSLSPRLVDHSLRPISHLGIPFEGIAQVGEE